MLAPNTLLQDRYLVMRLLGQGGMGAVYQATDRKFGNAVALKETFYSDLHLRRAFSHEARLLNRLRHAALPVVMDYFAIGERQFLVMQYIPGKDLEQLLIERKEAGRGVFLAVQVLRWADQLLDALEYLHSQKPPIIHRDIKPQNLKLTPRGEVILLDFGLAKGVTTHHSQVSQSIRGYTPNYASLEQIRGTGTDPRSDIYSIGATIYHLLTGEMPQDAMTRIAAMLMSQPDPLKPISELNPEVSPIIAAVIEKAMAAHPDQRYSSAALMRQALRNANRNVPPANFHRTPTLTDEPVKSSSAAAAAAALEPQFQLESGTSIFFTQDRASAELDIDHVIIPLDERGQEMVTEATLMLDYDAAAFESPRLIESRPTRSTLRRRSRARSRVYAILSLILILATIGVLMSRAKASRRSFLATTADLVKTTQINVSGPSLAIPMKVKALTYYLEVLSTGNEETRATGLKPLAAGSKFKFHFKPQTDGYLYMIALGKGGVMQTFLTERPMPASGVSTNRVEAGADFQFPDGSQWFILQSDADATPFTVIFSPKPLKSPAFLTAASGRDLTLAEEKELKELQKRLTTTTADVVVTNDNNQPTVTVQVPAERSVNEPLVFDISLKKR